MMNKATDPKRQSLCDDQLSKLRLLLGELKNNPFYQPLLEKAGLDENVTSIDEFMSRCPLTTKKQIVTDQLSNPPQGTNLTYALDRYTRYWQTSGTSAKPLRWLDDEQGWFWMLDSWDEIFKQFGITSKDRLFLAFSFGPFLGFWTAYAAAARMGCLCIPGGGMTTAGRLQCIVDNEATVLLCTPTYAIRLGEAAPEHYVNLKLKSKIKAIVVAGEPGGSIKATRNRIEELWPGAKVYDHHGMTEIGPVTWQASEPGHLIVNEASYLAEVIDPRTEESVAPGQRGELVLTTLGRPGSPLLRYRTGDLVVAAEQSLDERGYMMLQHGILGRADDMIHIRGVNVFPSAVEQVVRNYPGVGEYRVEITTQRGMDEMTLKVEAASDCRNPQKLARDIAEGLQTAFTLRIPVALVEPGELPRFDFKSSRWKRMDGYASEPSNQ